MVTPHSDQCFKKGKGPLFQDDCDERFSIFRF